MKQHHTHMLAIALVSASGLLLEISLTNLLSSIYFPPYVFAVIAVAILGIGIGAAIAVTQSTESEGITTTYAMLGTITTLILIAFAVFGVGIEYAQWALFILITLPFICIGLLITTLFRQNSEKSNVLYMADLIGAGIGSVSAVLIMNQVGSINSILLAGVGFGVVALILDDDKLFLPILGITLIAAIALASNMILSWLRVDMAELTVEKPITEILNRGGIIIDTHEDAFARTDVVDPNNGSPLRIYVNGAAASVMPPAGIDDNLIRDIGFFPFATTRPESVFVIGPGGGLDVWFGLQSGASDITAVEVNQASNDFVYQYAPFNGNLYGQPQVTVIADDGRRVLSRSDDQYDLIFLSQVVTLVAERNSYVLSENTIYTIEAFQQYLEHLTPDGTIALKLYDQITLTRAVSTAISALNERGLSDAEALQQMVVMLDTRVNPPIPLLMIRNSPYSREDAALFAAFASDIGYVPLLLPPVIVESPLDTVATGVRTFDDLIAQSESDISAPTDNRPYFFQFERGLSSNLQRMLTLIGVATLVGVVFLFITLRGEKSLALPLMMGYFAMLGIGFIAVEIVIIQQTRLVLGHPTFAVTLVLSTLLISGGIGSGLVNRIGVSRIMIAPLLVVVVVGLWLIVWMIIRDSVLAQSRLVAGSIVALSILPVGITLGMPFPLGLLFTGKNGDNKHIALAWTVNGIMSVAGTVLALVGSTLWGFQMVLGLGLLAYAIAIILSYLASR